MSDDIVTLRVSKGSLDSFRQLLNKAGEEISKAYEEAERTDDYSDADERAADYREDIHRAADSFMALLDEVNK